MPPTRYLSLAEFAARVGVSPDTLKDYDLPEADSLTGRYRGWLPETVDRWHARRPGRGARTDLHRDNTINS
ncbi:XRE family transcriptional regulator [Mycobacterium simiae]|uniref:XRE family transcriptional regulator n=1 Tax=Mycobacterium simiae TaxID=1784 RepID=A0A5B1BPR0_MYCSI|nr:XRE family transcriptional regulator [Mycobacterium simiae]